MRVMMTAEMDLEKFNAAVRDGGVHLVDVAGDPYHVQGTFGFGGNVIVFNTADIRHGRKLYFLFRIADDALQVLLGTEAPGTVFIPVKGFLRTQVTDLHVVYTCFGKGIVDPADKLVREPIPSAATQTSARATGAATANSGPTGAGSS